METALTEGEDPPNHDDGMSVTDSDFTTETKEQLEAKKEEAAIAKAESQAVFRLRLLAIAVLILSTVGVALAVYFYTSGSEANEFEEQFDADADKVLEAIRTSIDLTLGTVDAFVVSLVSYALLSNSSWPFVTIPDFAVRAAKIQSLSNAVFLTVYPYVTYDQRAAWEKYSLENDYWVDEAIEVQEKGLNKTYFGPLNKEWEPYGVIHGDYGDMNISDAYMPTWQVNPVIPAGWPIFNWDLLSYSDQRSTVATLETKQVLITEAYHLPDPNDEYAVTETEWSAEWFRDYVQPGQDPYEPISDINYPILDTVDRVQVEDPVNQTFGGMLALSVYWRDMIKGILPPGSNGIVIVFENECNPSFTFQINGPQVEYLGRGDLHDRKYDELEKASWLLDVNDTSSEGRTYTGVPVLEGYCPFYLRLYPSDTMKSDYTTNNPIIFTVSAILIFFFTSVVFLLYDYSVERRQEKVMKTAVQSTAIVSSLFPSTVRDRLFPTEPEQVANKSEGPSRFRLQSNDNRLKNFLNEGESADETIHGDVNGGGSAPIADLFPDCTVLFADIAGFTAWSSVREPAQVFTLLETLYGAFDKVATRRKVFKVETIGDCYVAVCGLPEPREDHAVVMVKFARDCRERMVALTRELEVTLGPDTGDLALRFGLHSGPVTAGVLRGQKSRFQLFGDTVNTAARMESNGQRNKIQVSQTTADLLIAGGKGHWVTPRKELVEAKGKGKMQTYWVNPKTNAVSVATGSTNLTDSSERGVADAVFDDRVDRLVDWNTDVLARLIRQIIARRNASEARSSIKLATPSSEISSRSNHGTVLDEVKEIIELPAFNAKAFRRQEDPNSIQLSTAVFDQLREYVITIATSYQKNPFHNFEHASHVTMSVVKLLSRIVAPDQVVAVEDSRRALASSLHDHTYGITSDPLTQFACVFAALIHDVDHPGVPNTQLVKEKAHIASVYKGQAIAEQNSVDIAWSLFMDERFSELRTAICATSDEEKRFRQLVVNSVMATDIMDKDLKALRNARWDKAFKETDSEEDARDAVNRKATIVIEHMIQASDVAHTMQHWHVYRKWNVRLFEEMYKAYQSGRAEQDPTEFWYKGEMGFFDFYIIPLAKKLKDCGVFGVSSDEYLNYAQKNREEWELRGQEVVTDMVEKLSTGATGSMLGQESSMIDDTDTKQAVNQLTLSGAEF